MILWLNGAFGAGKTQTAYELCRRIPGSYVFDPENAGFYIRKNIPASLLTDDFQDYPMWRGINRDMLDYIAAHHPGHIIVPMTITNKAYYEEIVGWLAEKYEVKHLILYAKKETLLRRLASRFETERSWAAQQIDRCIRAFDEDIPGDKIDTDDMDIDEVVERAAAVAGITLAEDRRGRFCKALDRIVTQYQHIR